MWDTTAWGTLTGEAEGEASSVKYVYPDLRDSNGGNDETLDGGCHALLLVGYMRRDPDEVRGQSQVYKEYFDLAFFNTKNSGAWFGKGEKTTRELLVVDPNSPSVGPKNEVMILPWELVANQNLIINVIGINLI